MSSVCISW